MGVSVRVSPEGCDGGGKERTLNVAAAPCELGSWAQDKGEDELSIDIHVSLLLDCGCHVTSHSSCSSWSFLCTPDFLVVAIPRVVRQNNHALKSLWSGSLELSTMMKQTRRPSCLPDVPGITWAGAGW